MKIVFMGTPDFAIPSLEILYKSRHEIAAVVTAPDKERGRGQRVSYTPVKQFALDHDLPLLQPEKMKDEVFIEELKKFDAGVFVIVAFRILPKEVFTLPRKVSFNLHASLLPKLRGAAPIQWALINGEKETGVTSFALEEKIDTGNIFIQERIPITEDDNFGSLHDKLSLIGADVVLKTIEIIDSGNYNLKTQDNSLATPAPKITKEITEIDWNKPADKIDNLVRGLSPFPGAYFTFKNKIFKIYKTKVTDDYKLDPGAFMQTKKELFVGCGSKVLKILELQIEGKRKLGIEEFLRGFSFN